MSGGSVSSNLNFKDPKQQIATYNVEQTTMTSTEMGNPPFQIGKSVSN